MPKSPTMRRRWLVNEPRFFSGTTSARRVVNAGSMMLSLSLTRR